MGATLNAIAYTAHVSKTVKIDDLIDSHGVAEILGLSLSSNVGLYQRRYPDMPKPVINVGRSRPCLWLRPEIVRWAKQTGRIS
jgi:hypothetical protein